MLSLVLILDLAYIRRLMQLVLQPQPLQICERVFHVLLFQPRPSLIPNLVHRRGLFFLRRGWRHVPFDIGSSFCDVVPVRLVFQDTFKPALVHITLVDNPIQEGQLQGAALTHLAPIRRREGGVLQLIYQLVLQTDSVLHAFDGISTQDTKLGAMSPSQDRVGETSRADPSCLVEVGSLGAAGQSRVPSARAADDGFHRCSLWG